MMKLIFVDLQKVIREAFVFTKILFLSLLWGKYICIKSRRISESGPCKINVNLAEVQT